MPRGTGFPARGFGTGRTLRPPLSVLSRPPSVFRRQPSHPILARFALLGGQLNRATSCTCGPPPPPAPDRLHLNSSPTADTGRG